VPAWADAATARLAAAMRERGFNAESLANQPGNSSGIFRLDFDGLKTKLHGVAEEIESLRKSLRIYRGLVEVSSLINSITDYDDLLRAILDVARRVIRAEAASLFLLDAESGQLDLVISSYADGEFTQPKIRVAPGQGIAGWVLEHGQSLLIPDAYADARFYRGADKTSGFRTRSILCAPLKRGEAITGVLQVLNPTEKDAFEAEDLEGFEAYSDLIATAIAKLLAIERMKEQERVERDVAIAAEIQSELLAQAIPATIPGAVFASFNKAAMNVGGDFFFVHPARESGICFAIGDVSGKGIPASLLMAQTLSAMQFVFAATASPAGALAMLNDTLSEHIVRGMFVTTLVGRMDPATRRIELASAGHCRPWHVRSDGTATEIVTPGALPLGVLPSVAYHHEDIELAPGDYLVSYTDGLSESRDPVSGEFFDLKLGASLARPFPSAQAIVDHLVAAESAHRDGDAARDDLTILVGGFE